MEAQVSEEEIKNSANQTQVFDMGRYTITIGAGGKTCLCYFSVSKQRHVCFLLFQKRLKLSLPTQLTELNLNCMYVFSK